MSQGDQRSRCDRRTGFPNDTWNSFPSDFHAEFNLEDGVLQAGGPSCVRTVVHTGILTPNVPLPQPSGPQEIFCRSSAGLRARIFGCAVFQCFLWTRKTTMDEMLQYVQSRFDFPRLDVAGLIPGTTSRPFS